MTGAALKIQGDDILKAAFARLTNPTDRRDLLDQIGAYGVSSTQQRFISGKGPDGIAWKQSRRAKMKGGQTLRDQNHLYASLTHQGDDSSVMWGSNRIYAAIHQFGGNIRPKTAKALVFNWLGRLHVMQKVTMPARPYLGINQEDRDEINATVHDWMAGRFA